MAVTARPNTSPAVGRELIRNEHGNVISESILIMNLLVLPLKIEADALLWLT